MQTSAYQSSSFYTEDQAKDIAQQIFYYYDRNRNGVLDDYESQYTLFPFIIFIVSSMMINNYKSINKQFTPTTQDLDLYKQVLDVDKDKQVSIKDFETLCLKYFAGMNTGGGVGVSAFNRIKGSSHSITSTPNANSNQPNQQNQYQLGYQPSQKQYEQPQKSFSSDKHKLANLMNSGNNSPIESSKPLSSQRNKDMMMSTNRFKESKSSGKVMTKKAQARLDAAINMFNQFDYDHSGFITEDEVRGLIIETYKQMGMDYSPTQKDIENWMLMTDSDRDGKVTLEEFTNLIIKSMEQTGVQVYE